MLPCVFEVLGAAAEEGGTFDNFVDPDIWTDAGFQLSADAPDVVAQYIDSLGSQKLVAKNMLPCPTTPLDSSLTWVIDSTTATRS